ncbi:hypothetical protein RHGRI_030110 [Rhododendron griersonianum]|uniref:UDP-glycosyltransferase n=1 Tax=Rhododendron griersonianum TaxID=479676 RepID=A0AAV6ILN1_9ERIC|nr:hypothetical protein RHGRI_030110 [Rhododendron griersonianum]
MDSESKPPMTKNDKLHIVMFPWLAFGHMIPFLELSKLIAQKGHRVTFVSTPKNIDRLPKLPPNLSPRLTLVKIPLPHVEKLPENAEATVDLPYDKVKYLKMAYDQLEQPITQLLRDASPDWVIYDFAPYWLGPIAARLGISSAYFSIFIAATLCFMGSAQVLMGMRSDSRMKPEDFTVPPKWVPFESTVAFRLFEINRIFDDITGDDENIPATYRFGAAIDGCDVVAVRSSYEFEPEWLQLLQEIYQKPVIPEKKMGYAVPRDDRDGSFTRDSVADSVRLVMVEEGGKIYRDKVREAKGLFVDGDIQDKDDHKLHIVMFPWLAFGHMIPFLELSKLIAQKGHRVTFVSTPKNIDRLPKLPPNLSPLITLVKIPLPRVEKLPEDAEATFDLPYDKVKYLKKAYDELRRPITQLIQDTRPDWVVYDFAPYWLGPIAAKLGVSCAFFSIFNAASLCFCGPPSVLLGSGGHNRTKPEDFTVPPKWVPFESTVAFRLFEIKRVLDDVIGDDVNLSAMYRMGRAIDGCDAVLVRSSYEFEPEWLHLLEEIYQKPIIPVGYLPPTSTNHDSDDDNKEWKLLEEKKMAYSIPRDDRDGSFTRDSVAESLRLMMVGDEGKIDDCLPEDAEATVDIPFTLHTYLRKAYDGLEPVVSRFLETASPDWVIYDIVQHWLPPIAAKMGIPCAYFGNVGNLI